MIRSDYTMPHQHMIIVHVRLAKGIRHIKSMQQELFEEGIL